MNFFLWSFKVHRERGEREAHNLGQTFNKGPSETLPQIACYVLRTNLLWAQIDEIAFPSISLGK